MTANPQEEFRLLVDAIAERAQPWLHRLASAQERTTQDHSDTLAQAAEHVAALLALARGAISAPATSAQPPSSTESATPVVQHITIRR